MEAHFNNFDYVVLGIMALSCLFAFFRGLVREILSLVAWIGAGIITVYYFPMAAEKMQPYFKNPAMAAAIGGTGLYIVALMGFAIINMLIIKTIRSGGESGMLDNLLGLVFGGLRGAFIISLGFFLLTMALPDKEYPIWVKDAVTRPYVEKGAMLLAKAAPDYLHDLASMQKRAAERLQAQHNGQPTEENSDRDENGYSRATSRQLDRLIDSTESTR